MLIPIWRRKDMTNSERIERMLLHYKRNQKYGIAIYRLYVVFILALPVFAVIVNSVGMEYIKSIFIIGGSTVICAIIGQILFVHNKKKSDEGKILIETNFNVHEMFIWSPGGKTLFPMGKYYFVSYYIDGECTYRFQCKVQDDQEDLCEVLRRLLEDGSIPKMKVLINPKNYKDYTILCYDFINDLINMNLELAADELDECYGTSQKWKYIK